MKITITIEIADGGKPVIHVTGNSVRREPKPVAIAAVAPPPIPPEPEPEPPPVVTRKGSGPQFDPGFLAVVRDAKEPFTRRSIAIACGLKPEDVTLRFIRMNGKGWIEQPAPGLWQRTKTFGVKP